MKERARIGTAIVASFRLRILRSKRLIPDEDRVGQERHPGDISPGSAVGSPTTAIGPSATHFACLDEIVGETRACQTRDSVAAKQRAAKRIGSRNAAEAVRLATTARCSIVR